MQVKIMTDRYTEPMTDTNRPACVSRTLYADTRIRMASVDVRYDYCSKAYYLGLEDMLSTLETP